ncbi:hypothetical protein BC937DRAFT_94217 [Endogone sp. FLAS-F59071]|nr:hypothetical protein BC937DRAFT_94217 [Endogone sp. FLAS-F59071]|eukprot:RUS14187.1 hypothetical protein BC937DRAFT_94217 [Endogone sp. FLAS-F59071]
MATSSPTTHIHSLPLEVLFQVFDSLLSIRCHIYRTNHDSDLKKRTTLRLVCRSWNHLLRDGITDIIPATNQAINTHLLPVQWPPALRWLDLDLKGPIKRGPAVWKEGVDDNLLQGLVDAKELRGLRLVNCLHVSDRILALLPSNLLMFGLVNQTLERSIYTAEGLSNVIQRCNHSLIEVEADINLLHSSIVQPHLYALSNLTQLTMYIPSSLEDKGHCSHFPPTCITLPLSSLPPMLRSLTISCSDPELSTRNAHLQLALSSTTDAFPPNLVSFSCALIPCTLDLLTALPSTITHLTLGWGLNKNTVRVLIPTPADDAHGPRASCLSTLTHLTLHDSLLPACSLRVLLLHTPLLQSLHLQTYTFPGMPHSLSFLSYMYCTVAIGHLQRLELTENWILEGCVVIDHFRRFLEEKEREAESYRRMWHQISLRIKVP